MLHNLGQIPNGRQATLGLIFLTLRNFSMPEFVNLHTCCQILTTFIWVKYHLITIRSQLIYEALPKYMRLGHLDSNLVFLLLGKKHLYSLYKDSDIFNTI